MAKIILIAAACAMLTASCSQKVPDLRSPCVGAEDSPCDRRAPAGNSA